MTHRLIGPLVPLAFGLLTAALAAAAPPANRHRMGRLANLSPPLDPPHF
jgi:hypothetical protein